nr:MAG TPA: hypothetical protein [Caudoviricetes sp.]
MISGCGAFSDFFRLDVCMFLAKEHQIADAIRVKFHFFSLLLSKKSI